LSAQGIRTVIVYPERTPWKGMTEKYVLIRTDANSTKENVPYVRKMMTVHLSRPRLFAGVLLLPTHCVAHVMLNQLLC
jgi:hypothetical protein